MDTRNRKKWGMEMQGISIQLTKLRKQYGTFEAVKQLDLTIAKGELFGFLGPNGAGKTTTIKMMTGLLEPTAGAVEICGVNIWQSPLEAKQHLAYVPDHPNLYPKLTGREFLRFMGSVFHMSQDVFERRMEEYLALFQLTDRADELMEGYSHGMKQKISICAALIHQPDVLFLDEPTVGLDPKSARTLKNLLRKLCDNGMTVFMSTHILEIAEQMCDRVGIILDGNLIALGTMEELRKKATKEQASLEDIFLQLTGDSDVQHMIDALSVADKEPIK